MMLAVTEKGFAVAFENFGNGHARGGFNGRIRIDEIKTEPCGQAAADGGFARAHNADEHD